MKVGSALIADAQPAELIQPSQGSLNHPTVDSQAAAVPSEAPSQDRLDPQPAQCLSVGFRVISSVSLNPVRSPARAAPPAPNRWNGLHQGQQLGHVMTISSRQDGGQGDSLGVGNQVVFAPRLAPVSRIGAGFSPRRPPLGRWRYPPLLETSRCGPFVAVWPAIVHEASARPRLPASLESAANSSSRNHTPFPGATFPRECRSSGQTGIRSAPDGRAKACGQGKPPEGLRQRQQGLDQLP